MKLLELTANEILQYALLGEFMNVSALTFVKI
jgi:hypothetical protein